MVSRAMPTPDQRMNTATARPTYPSTVRWAKCSTRQPARTAAEEITSFRLSTEVAWRVVDWMVPAQPGKEPGHPQLPQNRDDEHPKDHRRSVHRLGVEDLPHRGLGQVRPDHQDQRSHHQAGDVFIPGVAVGVVGIRRLLGHAEPQQGHHRGGPRPRGCSPRRPQGPPTRKTPPPAPCPGTAGRCTGCPPPPPAFPPPGGRRGSPGSGVLHEQPQQQFCHGPLTSHVFLVPCYVPFPTPVPEKKRTPRPVASAWPVGASTVTWVTRAVSAPACTCLGDYTTAPRRKARLTSSARKPPRPGAGLRCPGNFL